jgi:hypothetical protein
VSRTTHELAKAKEAVVLAAMELQADPTSKTKYVALVKALNDLERDRDTVQGAIAKAFANPARPSITASAMPTLLFNPGVQKAIKKDEERRAAEVAKRRSTSPVNFLREGATSEETPTVQDAIAKALGVESA